MYHSVLCCPQAGWLAGWLGAQLSASVAGRSALAVVVCAVLALCDGDASGVVVVMVVIVVVIVGEVSIATDGLPLAWFLSRPGLDWTGT